MWSIARRIMRNPEDAGDALQDALHGGVPEGRHLSR
jgi:hypothetical protein